MQEHLVDQRQRTSGLLTIPEQEEFDLIIANAKSNGWIHQSDAVSVQRAASTIVVRCTHGAAQREQCYCDDEQWLYELLRDLAHGMWK
jgi:hypothetical protein